MEQILIEAAKQAPALVVLALIVVAFLKFLKSEGEVARNFIERVMADHKDSMVDVVEKHATAMDAQAQTNEKLTKSHEILTRTILLHDATVRGENDNVMGTHEEIMGRVANQ